LKNNLRVLRATKNLTQDQLATELGVTRQTIIAIENDRYDPSLGLAFRIADFFEMKIEDVFQREHQKF
jgi:putative transcriptional regulator